MPGFIDRAQQNTSEELDEFSNVGPFGGVQSEVPQDQVEQFGQLDVLNMVLRKSVAETRPGFTVLPAYPAPANEDTTGIADFFTTTAVRVQMVMTLTRLLKWNSVAQNWVNIPPFTGLALTGGPADLFTWTVVNNMLCFCQGVDNIQVWDGIAANFFPASYGVILTTSLGVGGAGYAPGDTGTVNTGNGQATYVVNTVAAGAVVTYTITFGGQKYAVAAGVATTDGGTQPGVGAGFTINILTIGTNSFPAKYLMELSTHLVTAYTIENSTIHSQRVRWSGSGDPTDWTSPSSGINDLLGDLGPITGAVKLFQSGYIFSQWGVTQMVPTGIGTNPFSFVPLTTRARGNTIPYSLAAAGEEFCCYVGKDNIYSFNGTNSTPIGDHPVQNNKRVGARSRIFADLKLVNPAVVSGYVSDTINGQVFPAYWLVIPGVAIWLYQLDEQSWFRFSFADTLSIVGRFFLNNIVTWAGLVGTWAAQTLLWDQFAGVNPLDDVLLAFIDGVDGLVDFSSVSEQAWAMNGVFLMGDLRHSKTIQKFRVCIQDNGPVTFTIALSNLSGVIASETVTMGTGSGKNISQVLALKISGVRIYWTILGAAGQDLTLVEFAPLFKTASEQRGGTVDN